MVMARIVIYISIKAYVRIKNTSLKITHIPDVLWIKCNFDGQLFKVLEKLLQKNN